MASTFFDDLDTDQTPVGQIKAELDQNPIKPQETAGQYTERRGVEQAKVYNDQARAQATQQRQQDQVQKATRIKARDFFGQAKIPTYEEGGMIKPVQDEAGQPLTEYDKSSGVGWDSFGKPRSVSKDATGAPVLRDPYADAPQKIERDGTVYAAPKGLPWQPVGKDAATVQALDDRTASEAATALHDQARQDAATLKAQEKEHRASMKTLAEKVPSITTATDDAGRRAGIDATFDSQYAAKEANATTGYFGTGDRTPEANALRAKIDADKAAAHAELDDITQTGAQLKAARADVEQRASQAQQLRQQANDAKLVKLNAQRTAAGLAPIQTGKSSAVAQQPATSATDSADSTQSAEAAPVLAQPAQSQPGTPGAQQPAREEVPSTGVVGQSSSQQPTVNGVTPQDAVATTRQVLDAFTGLGSLAQGNQIMDDSTQRLAQQAEARAQQPRLQPESNAQSVLDKATDAAGRIIKDSVQDQFHTPPLDTSEWISGGINLQAIDDALRKVNPFIKLHEMNSGKSSPDAVTSGQGDQPILTLPKPMDKTVSAGITRGVASTLEGLTTPENVALLGALGGAAPVIQKAAGVGFTAQMMKSAADQAAELLDSKDMPADEKAQKLTELVGLVALAFMSGKHTFGRPGTGGMVPGETRPPSAPPDAQGNVTRQTPPEPATPAQPTPAPDIEGLTAERADLAERVKRTPDSQGDAAYLKAEQERIADIDRQLSQANTAKSNSELNPAESRPATEESPIQQSRTEAQPLQEGQPAAPQERQVGGSVPEASQVGPRQPEPVSQPKPESTLQSQQSSEVPEPQIEPGRVAPSEGEAGGSGTTETSDKAASPAEQPTQSRPQKSERKSATQAPTLQEESSSPQPATEPAPDQAQRRIAGPALVDAEGKVLARGEIGDTHAKLKVEASKQGIDATEATHAFVDDQGNVLTRDQAGPIAESAGQRRAGTKGPLHSEHLEAPKLEIVRAKLPAAKPSDWSSRERFVGEDFAGPTNSVVLQIRDLESHPIGKPIILPLGESMEATAKSVHSGFARAVEDRGGSMRESLVKVLDGNGRSVAQMQYTPEGMKVAEQGALEKARAELKKATSDRQAAIDQQRQTENATKLASAALKLRAKELKALDHPEKFDTGETKAPSGIEINEKTGHITINPEKFAKNNETAAKLAVENGSAKSLQSARLEHAKTIIGEEVEHLKTVAFENSNRKENAPRIKALVKTELEIAAGLAKSYKGWENLTDWQKGHEIFRAILQTRNDPNSPRPITESTYRLIQDFVDFLKKHVANLGGDTAKLVKELDAMLKERMEKAEPKEEAPPETKPAKPAEPEGQQWGGIADNEKGVIAEDRKGRRGVVKDITKNSVVMKSEDGSRFASPRKNVRVVGPAPEPAQRKRTFAVANTGDSFHDDPIINEIMDQGGLMSKSTAKSKWDAEHWRENQGEWDDAPRLAHPTHNTIYKQNGLQPNEMAQLLSNQGLLPEGATEAEMWSKINEASVAGLSARKQAAAAIRNEANIKTQDATFAKDSQSKKSGEPIAVADLKVGDKVNIAGREVRVINVDEDGIVTLEDGTKYGIQSLEDGQTIYGEVTKGEPPADAWMGNEIDAEKANAKIETDEAADAYIKSQDLATPVAPEAGEPAPRGATDDQGQGGAGQAESRGKEAVTPKLRPGEKGTGDLLQGEDAPFNLAGEKGVDWDRQQKEKADAAAKAKAAQEKADRDQQPLFSAEASKDENNRIFESAKKIQGVTRDVREAGYILPDGTMLDMSGRHQATGYKGGKPMPGQPHYLAGQRNIDHREIKWDGQPKYKEHSDSMVDFMQRGAVRVDANAGLISVHGREPLTSAQEASLRRLIDYSGKTNDFVYVDAEDNGGKRFYAEYDSPKPARVIGDLKRWSRGEERESGALFAAETPKREESPFYSQLTRTVEQLPQETMTVAQAKAAITKGAKPAEIKASGIMDDPLSPFAGKGPGEKVTKSELKDWTVERQTQVKDVTLGDNASPLSDNLKAYMDREAGYNRPENPEEWTALSERLEKKAQRVQKSGDQDQANSYFDLSEEAARRAEGLNSDTGSTAGETHFSQYQLPGADPGSYREMFVTWPDNASGFKYVTDNSDEGMGRTTVIDPEGRTLGTWATRESAMASQRRQKGNWEDGHGQYSDIQNPVVRIRRNIRTEPDGTKTYFIEEMQGPGKSEQAKMPEEVRKRIYEIGMKRAMRDASEEGASRIAWTTGEQQAERYSLEKHVDGITVDKTSKGNFVVHIKPKGSKDWQLAGDRGMSDSELASTIGKELAEQAIEKTNGTNPRAEFTGEGLKVGGEGLKRLYDVTLPRIADKLAEKMGAKTGKAVINEHPLAGRPNTFELNEETGKVEPLKGEGQTIHSIDLPESWQKNAPAFPLYAAPSPVELLRKAHEAVKDTYEGIADEVKSGTARDKIKATHDATGNRANYYGQQAGDSIRLDLPEKLDREAMPFVIESGGDKGRLKLFKAQITASKDPKLAKKYLPIIERATAEFDRLNAKRGNHDQMMADSVAELKAAGVDMKTVDDYVTRKLDAPDAVKDLLPNPMFGKSSGGGGSPRYFAKGRSFATLAEAIQKGFKPLSTDLAELDHHRIEAGKRIIFQRQMLAELKATPAPDGKPIIGKLEQRTLVNGDTELTTPRGYTTVNAAGQPLPIHDDYAGLFKAIYGNSAIRNSVFGRGAIKAAAAIKHGTLAIDTFHVGRMLYKMATAGGGLPGAIRNGRPAWNLHRGRAVLEYSNADLGRAVKAGEITRAEADWARAKRPQVEKLMEHGMNVGKVADNLMEQAQLHIPGISQFNKWIFGKLSRSAMLQSALPALERNLKNPHMTEDQAYRQTAQEMNELFGNMQNQGLFQSKTLQDISRLVFLAPNWTESQFRNEVRAYGQAAKVPLDLARGRGLRVGNAARTFAAGATALLAANQVANYLTRGHSTFENEEDGHKLDAYIPSVTGWKRGYWFNPLEIQGEYAHAAMKYAAQHENGADIATHIASNKLSPAGHALKILGTGRDFAGKHFLSDSDRYTAAATAVAPVPMFFGAALEKDPRQPLGFRANRQPGAVQKQLMQSAGLKVANEQSARSQMYAIAQPFRPDRSTSDSAGEYSELKRALGNDDLDSAKSELKWLYEKQGKTLDDVKRSMGIKPSGQIAPEVFAGGAEREEEMLRKLTPKQMKIYEQAQADHRSSAVNFLRIATLVPAPPAKPKFRAKSAADWYGAGK